MINYPGRASGKQDVHFVLASGRTEPAPAPLDGKACRFPMNPRRRKAAHADSKASNRLLPIPRDGRPEEGAKFVLARTGGPGPAPQQENLADERSGHPTAPCSCRQNLIAFPTRSPKRDGRVRCQISAVRLVYACCPQARPCGSTRSFPLPWSAALPGKGMRQQSHRLCRVDPFRGRGRPPCPCPLPLIPPAVCPECRRNH